MYIVHTPLLNGSGSRLLGISKLTLSRHRVGIVTCSERAVRNSLKLDTRGGAGSQTIVGHDSSGGSRDRYCEILRTRCDIHSGVSAASWLLGKPGTYQRSPGS